MSTWREWDWPQESCGRRGTPDKTVINVEISVIPTARRQRSISTRIVDVYFRVMGTIAKVVVTAVCTALVLGSIWFMVTIVKG
jgi:hypothetical protein